MIQVEQKTSEKTCEETFPAPRQQDTDLDTDIGTQDGETSFKSVTPICWSAPVVTVPPKTVNVFPNQIW